MRRKSGIKKLSCIAAILCMSVFCGCQDDQALENQQAYRQLGINKMNEGEYAQAVDAFQKALDQSQAKVGEMEIDICYYKATAQYAGGDVEGALQTCEALVAYNEKDAKAYFLRGCIYLKEEDSEKALADYEKAMQYSGDLKLYVAMYENLSNAGESEQAAEVLSRALEMKAGTPEEHRELGHLYLVQQDYENAGKELDQAINQGDAKALLYLAQAYDAQGNEKKAQALYESYIEKNGSDPVTLNILGEMQLEDGKYQKALELFQQALETERPENEKQLRRNEIVAYEGLLDFDAAKEKMASYVQDYPEDEEAQRENVFLQTR